MICMLGTPFTWAMVFSPIPHLYVVGLLVPLYGAAVAFILLENYEVLLHLVSLRTAKTAGWRTTTRSPACPTGS